jgi:low affinity Fe/Cu permease
VSTENRLGNGLFDRFAEAASEVASHARFFVACVLLVVLWVPSYFLFGSVDTWQLVINTATTIVTFLMVALLQNAQRRSDLAMHAKLDAIADGLADFMEHSVPDDAALQEDMRELRAAVGIERPVAPPSR